MSHGVPRRCEPCQQFVLRHVLSGLFSFGLPVGIAVCKKKPSAVMMRARL